MKKYDMSKEWESYEEVAAYLVNQFSKQFQLDLVEGKQYIEGLRSGTNWEIDAKGVSENGEGFIIVECRRYTTSKLKQEHIGAIAYRIIDSGAKGAIVVSPLGFQEGAEKIAQSENIHEVTLHPESTTTDYVFKLLNKTMVGASISVGPLFGDSCTAQICVSGHYEDDKSEDI